MRQWFCKIIVHTKFPISAANFTRKKNYFLYQSIITNFVYVLKTLNSFFPSNGLYAAISVRIRGTIQMKIHSLTLKIFIEFHMLPPDKKKYLHVMEKSAIFSNFTTRVIPSIFQAKIVEARKMGAVKVRLVQKSQTLFSDFQYI